MTSEDEELDVVTFLQRAGDQYRKHIEMMRTEKDAQAKLLAKPVICPYENVTNRDRGKVSDRLFKLWERRKANEKALAEQRSKATEDEEVKECTFQPRVNESTKQVPHRGSQGHISQEFLKKHEEKIEKLRAEAMRKEAEAVAPRPTSVSSSDDDHRQGLSVQDYLLMKEKQRQARLYAQAEQQIPAKPKISELAKRIERPGDVVSRLYDPNFRPVAYDENPPTFQPKIHSDYDDPLESLPVHERVIRRQVSHKSRIGNPQRSPSGKPTISERSQTIIRAKRSESAEGFADRSPGTRLYQDGIQRMRDKEVLITREQDVRRKFSYRPELTEESKKIVQQKRPNSTSAVDLYQRSQLEMREKQLRLSQIRCEEEAAQLKECTFTPRRGASPISKASASQDFSGWINRSVEWTRHKENKLHTVRVEKAEMELEQCTFQPLIHYEVPVFDERPKSVGYTQHIARMRKAQQTEDLRVEQLESGSTTPRKQREQTPVRTARPAARRTPGIKKQDIAALQAPVNRYDLEVPFYEEEDLHLGRYDARAEEAALARRPRATPRVDRGYRAVAAAPMPPQHTHAYTQPSPVDYILENHQAIVRGFRR